MAWLFRHSQHLSLFEQFVELAKAMLKLKKKKKTVQPPLEGPVVGGS